MSKIPLGFIPEPITISIDHLLLSRKVSPDEIASRKYDQIRSSIEEIGNIEPFVVVKAEKHSNESGLYILLDGHLRLVALQQLNCTEVCCLIATDDESYTFNTRVSRLSTIQEHYMIRRAIDRGVSPQRLAKALSVDVSQINKKLNLLQGICSEAAELLTDRQFSPEIARVLRKMKPTRQVECVELMTSANNLTIAYAEAMLVATPTSMLVEGKKPSKMSGVSQEQISKMEREMGNLQLQYKNVEQTYGQDVLHLVLAKGYLAKLLENQAVSHYLKSRQPEVFAEFEAIVQTVSIDQ
ncbi:ParB N-terminal domain-containing protein [Duganella sp. FT135W]|uniref:ParB N-terminal domain-containing protein n=1 Tax=Duganella flavida TaxID=2692175 RepID=A0A6L8KLN6_9BURK|nr:plasmid partitioning protein RepB C-terminal domain-containing protein [Duganella flavida]MYM25481.1 ParB N-terminal domain-containing protein [Duganella flavida]